MDRATEEAKAGAAPRRGLARDPALGRRGIRVAELTYREAVSRAIAQEMERDPTVYFLGEDVAAAGGVFKTTEGLLERFGPDRVRDTPICEQAIIGAAMGAAMNGLRPIAELMFSDFFAVCWDIVANQIAKTRYMTNGQVALPLVIRTANGGGVRFGAQHSQSVGVLDDGDPGAEGRGPVHAGRHGRAVRRGGPRSRPRDRRRAEGALLVEGRGARRRDRRPARARAQCSATGDDVTICALGAMVPKALDGRGAAGRRRRLGRGDRRPLAGAARHARRSWTRSAGPAGSSPSRRTRGCADGEPRSRRSSRRRRSSRSTARSSG